MHERNRGHAAWGIMLGAGAVTLTLAGRFAQAQSAPQEAPSGDVVIEEIVVTAQRRAENLQKVPVAATAFNAAALLENNVRDLKDLGFLAPSLKIDTPYGNTSPNITMRGVGSANFNQNVESTVALYVDELVMNPSSSKLGQLFDLERVEVLRGPQGTLYGKNSTGGAINYVTRKPSGQTHADFSASTGSFGEYSLAGAAETAINDSLSVRVAINRRYRDGYVFNKFTDSHLKDEDNLGARISFRYQRDGVDANLKLFGDRSHTQAFYINTRQVNFDGSPRADNSNPLTGYIPPADIDVASFDQPNKSNVDNHGGALNIDIPVGTMTLTSISGWLNSRAKISLENDGSPFPLVATGPFDNWTNEFSQELRLSSSKDSVLSWIAGVSFFHQKLKIQDAYLLTYVGLPPVNTLNNEKTTSIAGFVDGTWRISDAVSVFAGVRVTSDKKSFTADVPFSLIGPVSSADSKRWTEPTYRVGINLQATPTTMVYGSYNRGYRSGGYDTGFLTSPDQLKAVNPEFVDSFELGSKSTLFDRRLRLNTAAFYTLFKDQQLLIQRSDPGSICCSFTNAGRARIYGFEVEATARVNNYLDVNLQGTVLRATYQEFKSGTNDFSGEMLSNVPRYQLRIGPELHLPYASGEFFLSPEVSATGRTRVWATPDALGRDMQAAYTVVNGQAGYRFPDDRYTVFAYVKNATNKRYLLDGGDFTTFGFIQETYSEPRIFGLSVSARF